MGNTARNSIGVDALLPEGDRESLASSNRRVLVIDDEESIARTIERILSDEGFQVVILTRGEEVLNEIKKAKPSLVLLDIWLPGIDGIELLKGLKGLYPEIPVVMMSGHASISTAVEATRLGAADFIEKPIDLSGLLGVIRRVVAGSCDAPDVRRDAGSGGQQSDYDREVAQVRSRSAKSSGVSSSHSVRTHEGGTIVKSEAASVGVGLLEGESKIQIDPVVFSGLEFPEKWRGRNFPQRTLRSSAIFYGQGLHSGTKSGLILEPLPPNSGIHFVRVSDGQAVPAHLNFVESTRLATTLQGDRSSFGTIEHILSALHAYGISNLLLKCNSEVPVMDGSAREFCRLFDEIGTIEQPGEWYEVAVPETIRIGNEQEFIQIEPADEFSIEYTLSYPEPVGTQSFCFCMKDPLSYEQEIAPARTFGFVRDIGALQRQGLAQGGRFDNFVLVGDKGPINDTLRFPDEFVRHKILDAIGDLFLLGRKLRGKVSARMTGHSDNVDLLRALLSSW